MASKRRSKEEAISQYEGGLSAAPHAFLVSFEGITVPQVTELRDKIRESGGKYEVVKSSLALRAMEGRGLGHFKDKFVGPTAVAYIEDDPVALAKALTELRKEIPVIEFKGGLVDGQPVEASELEKIASLPSREELIARLLFLLQSPISRMIGVLSKVSDCRDSTVDTTVEVASDGERRVLESRAMPTMASSTAATTELESLLGLLSDQWAKTLERDVPVGTSLSLLHGLGERLAQRKRIGREALDFFDSWLRRIDSGDYEGGAQLENRAAEIGLPVLDPEEQVLDLSAYPGVVESVSDGNRQARVVLLDERGESLMDDIEVPLNWLPCAFREEGAGVYWIERSYGSGVKGRFEPGSSRSRG